MDMQNVSNLQIPEGAVRTIHDKDNRLIWGRLAYDTKYGGDTVQDGTPTPDTPIPVQVVTGAQTVEVHGKNLFNPNNFVLGKRLAGDGNFTNDTNYFTSDFMPVKPSTDYTYSRYQSGGGSACVCLYDANKTFIQRFFWNGNAYINLTHISFQTTDSTYYVRLCDLQSIPNLQLEEGTASTSYQPYQSQSYTINLGSIELCKIGNYQDYIYKSGDDWYVHKALGKYVFNGSETIAYNSSNHGFTINPTNLANYLTNLADPPLVGLCTHFKVNSTTSTWVSDDAVGLSSAGTFWCKATSFATSQSDCETWLTNNTPTIYYGLATATDTKITDATLVGQLNAVHEWLTRYGYNATVTGNLPLIVNRTNL